MPLGECVKCLTCLFQGTSLIVRSHNTNVPTLIAKNEMAASASASASASATASASASATATATATVTEEDEMKAIFTHMSEFVKKLKPKNMNGDYEISLWEMALPLEELSLNECNGDNDVEKMKGVMDG